MARVNVYLPDSLHVAVREARLPVSAICARALQEAVDGDNPDRPAQTRRLLAVIREASTRLLEMEQDP